MLSEVVSSERERTSIDPDIVTFSVVDKLMTIDELLLDQGLGQYKRKFMEEMIDIEALSLVSSTALRSVCGVPLGCSVKLIRAAQLAFADQGLVSEDIIARNVDSYDMDKVELLVPSEHVWSVHWSDVPVQQVPPEAGSQVERDESKMVNLGQEDENYEHIGFGHLEAIGAASASLALISTLVFTICIEHMLQAYSDPVMLCYISVSTVCSAYTICFSVLDYYYSQMFKGVDTFIDNRIDESGRRVSSSYQEEAMAEVDLARAKLQREVRDSFASLNTLRAAARNSMWLGLVCLVISAIAQIDLMALADGTNYEKLPSSAHALIFFVGFFVMVGASRFKLGSGAKDMTLYSVFSALGLLITSIDLLLIKSEFPTHKLVAVVILSSVLVIVPKCVLMYREPFMKLLQQYVNVL